MSLHLEWACALLGCYCWRRTDEEEVSAGLVPYSGPHSTLAGKDKQKKKIPPTIRWRDIRPPQTESDKKPKIFFFSIKSFGEIGGPFLNFISLTYSRRRFVSSAALRCHCVRPCLLCKSEWWLRAMGDATSFYIVCIYTAILLLIAGQPPEEEEPSRTDGAAMTSRTRKDDDNQTKKL